MALITREYTYSAGAVIVASQHNTNENTLYNAINGNLNTSNLASNAGIVDTQLATISTAGKVNVSALTVGSQATGDLIYASSASAWARLGVGTSSQVLLGGTTPSWGTAPVPAGATVQVVNTQTGASTTGTTTIPDDDTIPQNTEGDQYMTLAITPTSATNKLKIDVVFMGESSTAAAFTVALFQDSTANALAASYVDTNTNIAFVNTFSHYMTSGTTSATTFKVRAGSGSAGTTTFNGNQSSRKLGGVMASSITITEIKV